MLRRSTTAQSLLRGSLVSLCAQGAGGGNQPIGNHRHAFQPFSRKDEDDLVRVIATKPRHVLKHVRQLVWRSRKKELHFRNTVTQLMISLQDSLRSNVLDPAQASAIIEGTLEECVKLSQHDMAHLLFRSLLRFRKYGCTVSVDALRHLFESYRGSDSSELMLQVATEMSYDPELRPFCIAAYLFAGEVQEADKLRASVPLAEMTPTDVVAIVEGYDKANLRECSFELLEQLGELKCQGPELATIYRSVFRLCNYRDDLAGLDRAMRLCEAQSVPLDGAMCGNILRLRMRHVGSAADVVAVEQDLQLRGYIPDITGNSIIISAFARLAHYGDKGSEEVMMSKVDTLLSSVEARLQQGDPDMDISGAHLRAIIRGYGAAGRVESIKAAWPRLQSKGISDNARVYNELIKWYSLLGNVKDVLATKEEMDHNGIPCDTYTYSWVLRSLGKFYPRHVEQLYEELKQRRVRLDIGLYTTLVGIFGDLNQPNVVADIELEVRAREDAGTIETTPIFYAVLIRVHSANLEKVMALHHEATERGFTAHQHVITVLLHAYASHEGGREKMQAMLADMGEWSTETYNVLLSMHGKAGDVDKVKELLTKMRDDAVEMNDVTFGTLVTIFGRANDIDKVKEIITMLREKEGTISSHFYSVLATTMSRVGDQQGVSDAWEDLLASKLVPDTEVYNQFLALYGKNHNVAKMQSVMETMMRQVPPNPVTATTVLDMLGKSGRIAQMEALLEDMKNSRDAQPTAVTYHQVLNAYSKSGDVTKMEALLEEMRARGIEASAVTYNILADGYGRARRFEQLEDLLKRRAAAKIDMDELGYCVLIASYGRVRAISEVNRLTEVLRAEHPHIITKKVAWSLVDAYCRCKDYTSMREWMAQVTKMGGEHPEAERMAMLGYLCRAGLMEEVTVLSDELQAAGSELTYAALNAMARGYAASGRFDLAVRVLHKLRDRSLVPDSSTTLALSSLFIKAGLHEQAQQIVQWRRQFAQVAEEYSPDPPQ